MDVKDRIKLIIENERLTAAHFADNLEINRAVISHILNGRNNPSLDVVSKILSELDYVNPEWLINGVGNMYKDGFDISEKHQQADLFAESNINEDNPSTKEKNAPLETLKLVESVSKSVGNEKDVKIIREVKKISQIIIYYDDNTFETFIPTPKKI